MSYRHRLQDEDCKPLLAWWHWLDDNRGDRAQLRRAVAPEDILLTPAFAHFLQQMPARWAEGRSIQLVDAALVASIIARVKTQNDKDSFARALALPKEGGGRSVMSELRFQQLQKSRTPEEFFTRMQRALALLNGKADVLSVADNILHWLSEHRTAVNGDPQKRLAVIWASDYYAALPKEH